MSDSFNLVDSPWIPVVREDYSVSDVSLLDVFRNSSHILGIRAEIATQDVAILRLLIAIMARSLGGPSSMESWEEAFYEPETTYSRIEEYLKRYRERFDLRDPHVPFFQVAGARTSSGNSKAVDPIILDVPNNNKVFTMRAGEGIERISWAEAARWLIHAQAFDPSGIRSGAVGDPSVKGGKGYPIGPGWTGQLGVVVVEGRNLFETIMYNTVVVREDPNFRDVCFDDDLPPWELPPSDASMRTDVIPTGPIACMTWQSRRILLHGDDEGVTGLFLGNGDKLTPQNRFTVETMTAWRYSQAQTDKLRYEVYMPKKHRIDQSFWRSLPSILPRIRIDSGEKKIDLFKQPATLSFCAALEGEDIIDIDGLMRVRAVGIEYGSQEAVVLDMIDDSMTVPSWLFSPNKGEAIQTVLDAVSVADKVGFYVKTFARNLAKAAGADHESKRKTGYEKEDKMNRVKAQGEKSSRTFYFRAGQMFMEWLLSFDTSHCPEEGDKWRKRVRDLALRMEGEITDEAPLRAFVGAEILGRDSEKSHMDAGKASRIFRRDLYSVVPRLNEEKCRE